MIERHGCCAAGFPKARRYTTISRAGLAVSAAVITLRYGNAQLSYLRCGSCAPLLGVTGGWGLTGAIVILSLSCCEEWSRLLSPYSLQPRRPSNVSARPVSIQHAQARQYASPPPSPRPPGPRAELDLLRPDRDDAVDNCFVGPGVLATSLLNNTERVNDALLPHRHTALTRQHNNRLRSSAHPRQRVLHNLRPAVRGRRFVQHLHRKRAPHPPPTPITPALALTPSLYLRRQP